MTIYKSDSTKPATGNVLRSELDGQLTICNEKGSGRYIYLNKRARRELALELLAEDFDIEYPTNRSSEAIRLTAKVPPVTVGQYYRVESNEHMAKEYQNNPIVKVVDVERCSFTVETAEGASSTWVGREYLEGPIEAAERRVFVPKEG